MPKGSIKCTIASCEFESTGDLPVDGLRRFFTYFEEASQPPSFHDINLAKEILDHHHDTEEFKESGTIKSTGHSQYSVTLDTGGTGKITAHKGALSYEID